RWLTWVPAPIALWLRSPVREQDTRLMQGARRAYAPVLRTAMNNRGIVVIMALLLIGSSAWLATRLGSEFVPSLDEGDIALHAMRIPGTSLEQSLRMQSTLESHIGRFPEVDRVFAKLGTAEVATDPMPPSVADTFVMLRPRAQWPDPDKPKATLVREIEAAVARLPGNNYEFTQPIQMRMNELLSGVRADVAVNLHGDDVAQLTAVGRRIEAVVREVPGAADVRLEALTGLPLLTVTPDPGALARHGLTPAAVQDTGSPARGGPAARTPTHGRP